MELNILQDGTSSLSKITISPLQEPKNGTVALASVTIDNTITINSITIREKLDGSGLYVKMPQKRTVDGKFIDVAHPINAQTRQALNERIIAMYEAGNYSFIDNEYQAKVYNPKISARNCVRYSKNTNVSSNSIARLDILVSDFVVHNAKIVNNADGSKQSLILPSYRDKDGNYHSIVTPKNTEASKKLSDVALKEFNAEYKFKHASDVEIQALKEAKIPVYVTKSDEGKSLIRFKAENEAVVNNTLNAVRQQIASAKI